MERRGLATSTTRIGTAGLGGRRRRRTGGAGRNNLHRSSSSPAPIVPWHSSAASTTSSTQQYTGWERTATTTTTKNRRRRIRPRTASLLTRRKPIKNNWPKISKSKEDVLYKKVGGRGHILDKSKKTSISKQMPSNFQIRSVNDHDWRKTRARQNPWEYITRKPIVRKTYRAEEMEDTKCSEDAPSWFLHAQNTRLPPPTQHIKMLHGDEPGRYRVLLNADPRRQGHELVGEARTIKPDVRYGGRLQYTRPSIEWKDWAEARIRYANLSN